MPETGSFRVGDYVIRPDHHGWIVAKIKTHSPDAKHNPGEEYESEHVYPSTFPQALTHAMDLLVKDGLEPDSSVEDLKRLVSNAYCKLNGGTT